jgi:hypothetical protein
VAQIRSRGHADTVDDEDITSIHTMNGPMTRSRAAATPSRVPGPVCTKMDAQDASGLRLRRTGYGWKDNDII